MDLVRRKAEHLVETVKSLAHSISFNQELRDLLQGNITYATIQMWLYVTGTEIDEIRDMFLLIETGGVSEAWFNKELAYHLSVQEIHKNFSALPGIEQAIYKLGTELDIVITDESFLAYCTSLQRPPYEVIQSIGSENDLLGYGNLVQFLSVANFTYTDEGILLNYKKGDQSAAHRIKLLFLAGIENGI